MIKFALITVLYATSLYAESPKNLPPQSNQWMKDQDDQTDTLAIPLDSSEEEQKEEEESLEKRAKKPSK